MRFLPSVNVEVGLQMNSLVEWFVALWTFVPLDSTVGLFVKFKATSTCKCLGTLVTRLSICHLFFYHLLFLILLPDWTWITASGHFPFHQQWLILLETRQWSRRCSMIILSLSCHSNFKNQLTGTKGTLTRTLSTNWLKTDLLLLLPNWPQSFLPKTNLSPTHNLLFFWISIFNVSTAVHCRG